MCNLKPYSQYSNVSVLKMKVFYTPSYNIVNELILEDDALKIALLFLPFQMSKLTLAKVSYHFQPCFYVVGQLPDFLPVLILLENIHIGCAAS